MFSTQGWFYWALLSAVLAALTAIFAKFGLRGGDSDFATLLRTVVILAALATASSHSARGDAHLVCPAALVRRFGGVSPCRSSMTLRRNIRVTTADYWWSALVEQPTRL